MSSIRVRLNNETRALPLPAEEKTLLEVLRGAGYSLPAACGGRGRCGKCRVRINGVPRLACRVHPADGNEIELPETGAGAILTQSAAPPRVQPGRTGCAAAVDLGTTTVAVRLYDRADGRALGTDAAWNAQAAYGADVISRIQYTLERADGLRELSERIRAQVWALIRGLLKKAGRGKGDLREVVLAGNTAMQLLFTGHSVRGLAAAPFLPETLFRGDAEDALEGIPLRLVPCIAGYVGGDITAGLLASGLAGRPGRVLFLDAGTNGEMALGGRGGFLCCSVAAGPAFEGAGIACGMPGLPGAVSHVVWRGGFLMDVIGGGAPRGLCGSGLVDLAAVLLHLGAITPAGRLLPPEEAPAALRPRLRVDEDGGARFYLTPEVYLTAADVRALQLAKAAVAAGIRVLAARSGTAFGEIEGLYLAGGFGAWLSPESAIAVGMLPRALAGRIHGLGNTSLAGASMLALDGAARQQAAHIAGSCRYAELSGQQDFADAFAAGMAFDELTDGGMN